MKTIKLDEAIILNGAAAAKTTPEKFVGEIVSISRGLGVCAHFEKREDDYLVFSLSAGVRTPRATRAGRGKCAAEGARGRGDESPRAGRKAVRG